jgi:carbonic anhydrase
MPKDLNSLLAGYKIFRKQFESSSLLPLKKLAVEGQKPKAIIISCCDSRVDPALLFNTDPGDLFVVRNVANLVPPCEMDHGHHGTSAALEFAVCGLQVRHVILLGHSQCGGIQALMEDSFSLTPDGFIQNWMALAHKAKDRIQKEMPDAPLSQRVDSCAQLSLMQSLKNLKTFPWVASRLKNKTLELHAWFFDIRTAELLAYDEKKDSFEGLDLENMRPD